VQVSSVMLPLFMQLLRHNAPLVMLPITFTVGFIGYNIESFFRKEKVEDESSVLDKRSQRLEAESLEYSVFDIDSEKKKTIFIKQK